MEVSTFEQKFLKYIGTKYATALNSGTSALIAGLAALKYLNIAKAGTKIITTPLTYISTSSSIVLSRYEPQYVGIDSNMFGITPENIKIYLERIDDPENHSVILPVHLMGYVCDMKKINQITKNHGLVVFEDSAQALRSIYNGKYAGKHSPPRLFILYRPQYSSRRNGCN